VTRRFLTVALVVLAALTVPAAVAGKSPAPIRLPFHVKNGLILIDGRVDSTPGVFMLDTGETYFRFVLNRNYVPLGPGTDLYRMHAESGQVSMTQVHDGTHTIEFGGAFATTAESGDPKAPHQAVSDDFRSMMHNVDPKILGGIGYAFLKQYDFTIDYARGVVALYPLGLAPKPTGSISIAFVPSSPPVPFTLKFGGADIPAVLDTGGWEELKAPQSVWTQLESGGFAKDASGEGKDCVTLSGARYGAAPEFAIPHVDKAVTQKEEKLTLGYPFLRRYLNIYSSRDGTVTLVPLRNVSLLPPESCE